MTGRRCIDLLATDIANGAAVWRALAKFGAPVGDISPDEMAQPGTFFTWGNPPFRVDIITRISGVEFDDAWEPPSHPHRQRRERANGSLRLRRRPDRE
jgi:hypothetical protein